MIQTSLLPERIRRIDPNPIESADSPGIGVSYTGQRFVLKVSVPPHPYLPASEWICHGLAHTMHLAVPHWTRCVTDDGKEFFGSRFEGDIKAQQYQGIVAPTTDNPWALATTFVLDMFVANMDRHPGNWIETESAGVRLLRPIDFSRALLWRWPLPTPPFGAQDNSGLFYSIAIATGALQKTDAIEALEGLIGMKKDIWRTIVLSVPGGWLPDQLAKDLINWWWSPQWRTRIQWIRSEL